MAGLLNDRDRNVIPQWRESRVTISSDEVGSTLNRVADQPDIPATIEDRIWDWEHNQTPSFAEDLINAAFITGDRQSTILEASEFLIAKNTSTSNTARRFARHILGISEVADEPRKLDVFGKAATDVHEIRLRLRDEPRNAIARVDLARAYTILGLLDKADREMRKALSLAPENRFVLRSASRLYIHREEYRYAHDMLRKNEGTRSDPWLLAAEIAVANVAKKSSINIKGAIHLLNSDNLHPRHLSELASAVGTIEAEAGKHRLARKRFSQSLIAPTSNSIAQAAWASRKYETIPINALTLNMASAFEARAWNLYQHQRWQQSLQESKNWFYDQPFSSRPAILGSFIATVALEDYAAGIEMAEAGLQANSHDFALTNNLAYALALNGSINEARDLMDAIRPRTLATEDLIVYMATNGLIALRSGDTLNGSMLYEKAIDFAHRSSNTRCAAIASINYAIEAQRLNLTNRDAITDQAVTESKNISEVDVVVSRNRLLSLLNKSQ